jgi:tRNA (cmo5U34)-methyltransferase
VCSRLDCMVGRMGWDPDTYLTTITEEIPDYELLQVKLVEATRNRESASILELGTGSGETARRLLTAHPKAHLHGIDSSPEMLGAARTALEGRAVTLEVRSLEDSLPRGLYDLVVSALTVHHLDATAKRELFTEVAGVLRPGGRFVLADVVIPEDPADALTPIEPGYDFPARVHEQLEWLQEAALEAFVFWTRRDLAVLVGDRALP